MLLELDAQIGDQSLRGLAEQLGQCKGSHRLDQDCGADNQGDPVEQLDIVFLNHVINQILGRARKYQTGQPIDDDQDEP